MIQQLLRTSRRTEMIAPALKGLLKGMRARYIIALLSVAVLSSVAYIGFNSIISTEDQSAEIINMSGRQRMLSQRIPMLAQLIAQESAEEAKRELISEFDTALSLMRESHASLIYGDKDLGIEPLRSHTVHRLLFGDGVFLDKRLATFFGAAEAFSGEAARGEARAVLIDRASFLANAAGELLPLLNEVVITFEGESQERIRNIEYWQLTIFLATLSVLVLEGLVIFWPLERELSTNFRMLLQSRARAQRAQDEANRANRAKSEFLANMSHELRTPLNAINGFSEMMSVEAFGPLGSEQYKDYSHDILKSGRLLLRIIDDILDIAQIESENIRLSEDVLDVERMLQDACDMLKTTAALDEIEISIAEVDVPYLVADGERINQIIVNLVSNAVRFSHKGGKVSLAAHCNSTSGITISVRDNGIGIHPDHQVSVMDPFSQIEEAYTRGHGGSGLGLTISNSLMKLHGGVLTIDSEPGKGTEVRAHFPASRNYFGPDKSKGSGVEGGVSAEQKSPA